MNRIFFLALVFPLLLACHSLPVMEPAPQDAADMERACRDVFPHRPWRMVHTITTNLAGRKKGVMIGVVSLSPDTETVECALLTIEGMRLFEARDDGTLTVRRALPPFDRPALAEGMMADIRLLFFQPEGQPEETGILPGGTPGCRYATEDGYLDILRTTPGTSRLERYDHRHRLIRRVTIEHCRPAGAEAGERVACHIHLEALGANGYELDLDLVEARPALDNRKEGS